MFLQYVPFCNLFETVLFYQYIGAANASNSIDNIVTCPKERKRELDRARRAALSPEQKVPRASYRRGSGGVMEGGRNDGPGAGAAAGGRLQGQRLRRGGRMDRRLRCLL